MQKRFSLGDSYVYSLPDRLFSAIAYTKHTSAPPVLLSLLWRARSGAQGGVLYGISAVLRKPSCNHSLLSHLLGNHLTAGFHACVKARWVNSVIAWHQQAHPHPDWLNPPRFLTLIVPVLPLTSSKLSITTSLLPPALFHILFFVPFNMTIASRIFFPTDLFTFQC